MNFTEEQTEVISARKSNILVSAAAGSGKTAVLVERIIELVTGVSGDQIDIDHLLVVTFTRAAASQMKDRVMNAIEELLQKDPANMHLQKQETLIHNAQITTIDSFCQFVIRNNFSDIDLDPCYRVGDEGEMKLLQQEVMGELLEKKYDEAEPDFLFLSEYLSSGNNDRDLENTIMALWKHAQGMPFPVDYLADHSEDYDITPESFDTENFVLECIKEIQKNLITFAGMMDNAVKLCEQPDGPYFYAELFERERDMYEETSRKKTYDEFSDFLASLSFDRLPSKKDTSVDPEKRDMAKGIRDNVKKKIQKLSTDYFGLSKEDICSQMSVVSRALHELCSVTIEYSNDFDAKKREKNIIDFGDMEHFALNILVHHENGAPQWECTPTDAALEYREYFKEILIDEYQDSNSVQELIMEAISSKEEGSFDRFMVGDVKQSIYRFRLARPEIFMEKLGKFSKDKASHDRRIDLHKNFRSRSEVLDSTNFIFDRIMGRDLGGVIYDEDARLRTGASFPDAEPKSSDSVQNDEFAAELILIQNDDDSESDYENEDSVESSSDVAFEQNTDVFGQTDDELDLSGHLTPRQQEAMTIAHRIKELMTSGSVYDAKNDLMRKPSYKDIVILMRATNGWDDTFRKILEAEGIPAYIESKSGYFDAGEVVILLQLLSVLDNPLQDIPLVALMHSFIFGFTNEELALIKANYHKKGDSACKFYDIVCSYLQYEEGEEAADCLPKELREKIAFFTKKIRNWRGMASYMPVHELLLAIFEETGFEEYVTAMPQGARRKANVEMLLEKASAYEKTSFKGLFNFVRYIENLKKYEVDYGEANILDENADVVRIMSIHKSKGLEFPIVFVAGLSKKVNLMDTSGKFIADSDMGIGMSFVDSDNRIRMKTLRQSIIAGKMERDTIGEELRILYVAMTRAKEKLIMTGVVKKLENKVSGVLSQLGGDPNSEQELLLPLGLRDSAKSYMDFMIMALVAHPSFRNLCISKDIDMSLSKESDEYPPFDVKLINASDIHAEQIKQDVSTLERKMLLLEPKSQMQIDEELSNALKENFAYEYPHKNYEGLYTKTTVTALKKAILEEKEEASRQLFDENIAIIKSEYENSLEDDSALNENDKEKTHGVQNRQDKITDVIPKFMQKGEELIEGAERGTAYHKVCELLDGNAFANPSVDYLDEWMKQKEQQGILPAGYRTAVDAGDIAKFIKSDIGIRMQNALKSGKLYREKPFMMGINADRVEKSLPKDELLLIQGIVDAWFIEDDSIILLDYKTDRVKEISELSTRYKVQLDYYQEALEKITGMKVLEKIIYAFHFGQELRLD